jgi:hypothetical protein
VRGKLVSRGRAKRADYVLYFKPNIPLALIEAKDNSHSAGGFSFARSGPACAKRAPDHGMRVKSSVIRLGTGENIMFELIKQFAEQLTLSRRPQPEPEEDWGGGDICSPQEQAPTDDYYPLD